MKWSLGTVFIVIMLLVIVFTGFAQEKVTITIQDYFDPAQSMGKFINERIVEFENNHPNVKINHTFIPFNQLLSTILQESITNTIPEIIMVNNPNVSQLIKGGVLKNLTDKVKEWGWENWEDFLKGYRDNGSYEGKIYAFQITGNNLVLFYRESLLEKAGIANPPETWQELKEQCEKIKEVLDITPLAYDAEASDEGSWQFYPFLWSNGGSLLELDQPEAIEALQFLADMFKEGCIPRDVLNITSQGDLTPWFTNGDVAFMINGCWEFGWHLTPDVMQELGDVKVTSIPVPKKGIRPIVAFGGECYGISSNIDPAKYDVAWEFLESLLSTDNNLKINIDSGSLPTRASAVEKILAELPILEPFLEQSKHALPMALMGGMENYGEISSILWVSIQKAFTGIATPEEVFKEAAQEIKGIFTPEDYEMYKQLARELLQEASKK
jgi:multiple sugar transport system substrate-binding protein